MPNGSSLIAPEALRWGKRVINRGAEIAGFRAAVEAGVDFFVSLYATQTEVGTRIRPPRPAARSQGGARMAAGAIFGVTYGRCAVELRDV